MKYRCGYGRAGRNKRVDIVFLHTVQQVLLIRKKPVGSGVVHKEQNIDHSNIHETRGFLHEIRKERKQHKTGKQDERPDEKIGFFIEKHQRTDLFAVLICNRLIQLIRNGRAEAEFRKGQHREDAAKKAVYAKILLSQHIDKHRARREGEQHTDELSSKACYEIAECIDCSHDPYCCGGSFLIKDISDKRPKGRSFPVPSKAPAWHGEGSACRSCKTRGLYASVPDTAQGHPRFLVRR